jgi:putative DNA primase/helicase
LTPILGSPGERYLSQTRGIDTTAISDLLERTDTFGWNPSIYFNERGHPLHGQKLGCIVGIMTDPVTAQPTGAISRTYIGPDCKKVCKAKTLGEGGGVIRLSHYEDALHGLFLAEGKETCLAAAALGLTPIWATGSATTIAKFPLVAGIESLTLIADHDANGAGERAARKVETRWIAAGREVRILRAKAVGYDLDDALKRA